MFFIIMRSYEVQDNSASKLPSDAQLPYVSMSLAQLY